MKTWFGLVEKKKKNPFVLFCFC